MVLTQRQCGCPTGYYIIFSATPPGLLKALLLKGGPSHQTTSHAAGLGEGGGGGVQYKSAVSKLHC